MTARLALERSAYGHRVHGREIEQREMVVPPGIYEVLGWRVLRSGESTPRFTREPEASDTRVGVAIIVPYPRTHVDRVVFITAGDLDAAS